MENKITMLGLASDELKELIKEALTEYFMGKAENQMPLKDILTIEEVCELMSITRQTLNKRRKMGEIPAYQLVKRGRVFYKREEILKLFNKS